MKIKYLFMSVLFLAITACDTDTEEPNSSVFEFTHVNSGDADFSSYVAMGGSITAGVTDGSLFIAGQMGSYPNIMASVMSQTETGGAFTQPYVDDNVGGINVGGNQFWGPRFFFDGAGPAQVSGTPSTEATNVVPGPYSNLAFPFASAISYVAPGVGSLEGLAAGLANPWFVRAASNNNASMVGDALTQQPTFVTFEPGNDFFNYALTGRFVSPLELEGPTGMLAGVVGTLQALSASVPNGVITNLPDPTNTATFNTVDWNPIPLDAATAGLLNAQLAAPYNGGLAAAQAFGLISAEEVTNRTITFVEGLNAVTMEDEYLTNLSSLGLPSWRQATMNDKIVLPAIGLIGTTVDGNPTQINGVSVPLADGIVLSYDEIAETQARTVQFNATIETITAQQGWALYDAYGILNQAVTQGVAFDDYVMTTDLVFGGFFSLDGVHTTARGSALIANGMMEAIDAHYGSNLSDAAVKAGDYPTNYSPNLR